ncbi:MAG: hypothetical protein IJJ26_09965 [Victivallales bacterium]|nr:hypothetical protein [Victivallales bacterium]
MLITNIAEACGILEPIRTSTRTDSAWRKVDYETMDGICGSSIFAPAIGTAEPLHMSLPVLGRCRIYVGIAAYGNDAGLNLRLERDKTWRVINALGAHWYPEIMEYFFREDELDGRGLEIKRFPGFTSLMWVRLEPIPVKQNTPPAFEALVTQDGYSTATFEDYLDKIVPLKDVHTTKFFFCLAHGDNCPHYPTKVGTAGMGDTTDFGRTIDMEIANAMEDLQKKHPNFVSELIDFVHSQNMEFHVSVRTGAFYMPGFPSRSRFFMEHPEYHCRLKDGTEVSRVSLAVPEVRRHFLDLFREMMGFNCDGLQLLLCRALPFVLFEQAFCEQFHALHGLSPLELPETDPRILQLREEIVTSFLRELRTILDEFGTQRGKHLQLTLTVPATGALNESFGLNLRKLALEKVIDNITVDGTLLDRVHSEQVENIEFAYFQKVIRGTSCRWYARAPHSPAALPEHLRKALAFGASGLLFWDACEAYMPKAEYWETLSALMRNPDDKTAYPIHRIFPMRTFDGLDWNHFAPHNGF